jgi:transporter family-2 protein
VDRGVAVLLTAGAGGLIALQAPINAGLGKETGSLPAALCTRPTGAQLAAVPWWAWIGGLLGAVYVANALIAVSAIGAGGVAAATVAGQLTASVVIDRLGLFGLDEVALSPERLLGVALLIAGTLLVVR